MKYRSEDYRKHWQRKANLHLVAVAAGALLGSVPSLLDRFEPVRFPHFVLDGALISSTIVGTVSFFFYE